MGSCHQVTHEDALACAWRKCELQDKVIIEVNLTEGSTGMRGREQIPQRFAGAWLGWGSSKQELNPNTAWPRFCVSAMSFHERFLTHAPP